MKFRCLVLISFFYVTACAGTCRAAGPEIGASFRSVAAAVQNYNFPLFFGDDNGIDFISQNIFRVTLEGTARGRAEYEIHAVQSFNYSSSVTGGMESFSVTDEASYRALDATAAWVRRGAVSASLWLDRFNVRFSSAKSDITVGRQAVTFGKAYFWNPLDVFNPFEPGQFDRDYKPGADAVRYDVYLDDFSGVNVVAAFGPGAALPASGGGGERTLAADTRGSALLLRYYTTKSGWDYSMQAGKLAGGYQFGGGAVGEAGAYQLRAEAAWFFADDDVSLFPFAAGDLYEDSFACVLGIGRYYKDSLDLELEYLWNGAGDPGDMDAALLRSGYGASPQMGRSMIGAMAAYQFTPLITGRLSAVYSFSDRSGMFHPGATLSLSDNSEILFGATVNSGRRPVATLFGVPELRSEFGAYPNYFWTEYKIYF